MSTPSISESVNSQSTRRVARRACLSCREKKIKCDGEPVSTITIADGTSKIIPEKTRTCSNCAFLDIECVFVQSNRGGRRKKRDPNEPNEGSNSPDFTRQNRQEHDNRSSIASSTERVSSYILGNDNVKLPSPIMSHVQKTYDKGKSSSLEDITPLSTTSSISKNSYSFPRPPPPPSTTSDIHSQYHHHLPPLHHHSHPPHSHSHPPPPGPPGSRGPPPPPPFHSGGFYSLPPPPDQPGSPFNGPPPPPPPQHFHFHGPPPHHFHHGPPPPHYRPRFGPPHHRHGYGPPHFKRHHHKRRFNDYDYYYKDEDRDDMMEDESSSSVSPEESEKYYNAPISNFELSKYELPKWEILDKILTYYYIYNQPSHQFFPNKSILIQNLNVKIDASVIHAIIATICLIIKRKEPNLNMVFDEMYWINKMNKFWENLNDLGIISCYKLISKCTSIRFNMKRVNDMNIKICETINDNHYIEIFSQKRFEFSNSSGKPHVPNFGTKRQIYEREVILKLIWTFYLNHIILLRFNQGRPYYKLSSILDGFKFDYERDHYSNNILLPLDSSNFNSLNVVTNRVNWNQLFEPNYVPTDSASLILSVKIFETLMTRLSNSSLTFDNSIYSDEFNLNHRLKISNLYYEIKENRNIVVINVTYWFANLILRIVEIIQSDHFISEVMIFKTSKFEFKPSEQEENIDELSQNTHSKLISDEFLPETNINDKLKRFTSDQWKSLIELVISFKEYVKLIELIPDAKYSTYNVVIGPTYLNSQNENKVKQQWYEDRDLATSVKQSWNKLPMYTLSFSAANLSIFSSVAVLTKYLKFSKNANSKLQVEFLQDHTVKELDIALDTTDFVQDFDQKKILSQLSTLCEYIKFKLYYSNEDIMMNSIRVMNKLNERLDTILSS